MLVCIRLILLKSLLFLLFFLIRFSTPDRCYNSTRVNVDKNISTSESVYRIIGNSQSCAEIYNKSSPLGPDYDYPVCPTGLVSVSVTPTVRIENNNLLPHIELNISATVYDNANSVFIRLQCLHAPDAEDIYCHDAARMSFKGKWLWPCRAIIFDEGEDVSAPFTFGYSCFRMFGLSQYMVNVTIFPQQCRSSLLVTSPSDSQLSPEIGTFYANKNISTPDWSPLLIVDFGDEDGLWLRVEGPSSSHARVITVSIFERHVDGVLRPLQSVNVVHPSTGFKWRNVAKGEYVVYAHIPRHDCMLICDNVPTSSVPCRLCAHTAINFSLPADRASLSWKGLRRMRDSSSFILFALACVLLGVALCSMFYLLVLRRRVRRTPAEVRDIELQVKPLVLLLTPDDCGEYSAVVLALSRVLEEHAKVTVLLDHHEMSNSVVRPYRWLLDSICRASKVLIVISPCSQLVLDGQNLRQRRPFPDLFVPAINMIIKECTEAAPVNKYIICRLPFSPTTPSQLAILGLPEVEVPSNFARLTALIHSIDDACDHRVPSNCPAVDEFNDAVETMMALIQRNPDWMQQRICTEDANVESSGDLNEIPKGELTRLITNDEREKAAEIFGVLPPEPNEVDEANAEFPLLPPDED
uniref:SEFIR domain-containing protein n=1 Tax=Haemonchus contortus TaxID=6289 RepID=A0A7I5E6Y3_HAECO